MRSLLLKVATVLPLLLLLLEQNGVNCANISFSADSSTISDNSTIRPSVAQQKLILTPYITAGKLAEAISLSRVHNNDEDEKILSSIPSYSGYFTVNETTNSNLFFWFFPSTVKSTTPLRQLETEEKAPLILWLQGGPGTSSLFGLFVENGPFGVNEDLTLWMRNSSWTQAHSVLYIDSPVGTGFSFTDSDSGYATNQEEVVSDLYRALEQFFILFPEFQSADFYIAGESYAGKYVPSLAMKIHNSNLNIKHNKINLKGLIIGAGFSDPISMIDYYGEYLYNMGMIDENGRKYFDEQASITKELIKDGNYSKAAELQDNLIGGETLTYPTYFKNKTGYDFYYNVLQPKIPSDHSYYIQFVEQDWVRSALHVGNTTFHNQSLVVPEKLVNDIFDSVKPTIEQLLELGSYNVLLYVGQFDIVVPHGAIYNFIKTLNWVHTVAFLSSERKIWLTDDARREKNGNNGDNIGGYIKSFENLSFVIIREAGHNAPYDQPELCQKLIANFIGQSI